MGFLDANHPHNSGNNSIECNRSYSMNKALGPPRTLRERSAAQTPRQPRQNQKDSVAAAARRGKAARPTKALAEPPLFSEHTNAAHDASHKANDRHAGSHVKGYALNAMSDLSVKHNRTRAVPVTSPDLALIIDPGFSATLPNSPIPQPACCKSIMFLAKIHAN